ncbi:FtsX-like permease family protein [Micromonosporaceae bacterium Da 78-11]
MIRLGLRLAVAGGREAVIRLAVIAAAVAVGAAMLLATVAGINAVQTQNDRYAWLNTGFGQAAAGQRATGPVAADPAWWMLREDYFHGDSIGRVDVATTGPDSVVPPGLAQLPGPGEYYVSPALGELLRTTPAEQLGDRFPGRAAGLIGDAGLPSPDMLLIVVGRTPAEMAGISGARQVDRIFDAGVTGCQGCVTGVDGDGISLVLGIVAVALIFPLLIFVGTATRLSAARREQRFAAMRLIGATPRQISVLATVESAAATTVGTLLGFVLFLALRHPLAALPITGRPFFPADLTLTATDVVLIASGIPLAAALAARLALRRVRISPLGVTRRVSSRPPGAWRLLPVLAGVAELTYSVGHRPMTTNGQLSAYLGGIILVMTGLLVAGPWLTLAGSRMLARLARRPAGLIAGRRLADDPKAGFRAVSGLMLALFVTTVATGVITTLVAERGYPPAGSRVHDLLTVASFPKERVPGQTLPTVANLPPLTSTPGVRQVLLVRENPDQAPYAFPGVIDCAELAGNLRLGPCADGTAVAAVFGDLDTLARESSPVTPAQLATLPVLSVAVDTDGSDAALERTRTMLEAAYPDVRRLPATEGEYRADFANLLVQFQQLADVVIVASLVIAACSLAVSITGGLNERKRPFSMLRLAGLRISELRRVVALESAVPVLLVAVLAIGAGLLSAHLFLRSQLQYSLHLPGPAYYVIVVGGLVFALGVIASTMPLLRRITGPETARNE